MVAGVYSYFLFLSVAEVGRPPKLDVMNLATQCHKLPFQCGVGRPANRTIGIYAAELF